ncbi:MAG: hypothetical protein ACRDV3_13815 [Acidothermaceae bacterium]
MPGTKTLIAGFAAVCIVAPPIVQVIISLLRRSRSGGAHAAGRVVTPTWRLSHKLGNVFALTNITGDAACDVAISSEGADVEVRPRHAPWPRVTDGGTVEFVVIGDPPVTGAISIKWTTENGTARSAEMSLVCEPVDGLAQAI